MSGLQELQGGKKKVTGTRCSCTIRVGDDHRRNTQADVPRRPAASPAAGGPAAPGAARGPRVPAAEAALGGAWGVAPRGGQAEKRRLAPDGSTLPFFAPSQGAPLRGTGGAQQQSLVWGGGVLCGKSSAALEWRPQVINKLHVCPGAATAAGRRLV